MKTIIDAARTLEPELVANRRHLHANPELGDQLPGTCAFVTGKLDRLGIEWRPCGPSGIVACLGKPGRTLLLRGDMDALPMTEATDLPFRATNGCCHSCGHDFHTTMLLGAAAVLKQHEGELGGTVKLMFQPAEETGTGAKGMLDAGVLEAPKVDAALAMHVASYLPTGMVLLTPRTMHASHDTFNVVVQGKGGHSSSPYVCIDPLNVVATIYMMLGSLVSRAVDPFETAVLTVGKLGGGTANNIIPDTAELAGGLRCYNQAVREQTVPKIHAIIERITQLMGASFTLTTTAIPILLNDMDLRECLLETIREVVGAEQLYLYDKPLPGTEDFSFIAEQVPSLYMVLGAGQLGGTPHHNPKVVFDEQALATGTALYANCAMEWLQR